MCFTMGMSAFFGTIAFAWAGYEWKQYRCLQYSLGMGYFGLMEWLQVFQHMYAAGPEDDYAMCANKINQDLTEVGVLHIVFQPLFVCMGLMSMHRRYDIQARFEADLLWKMCFFGGLWFGSYLWGCKLLGLEPTYIHRATEDCPNYMWLHEGYDGFLGQTTPNIPGKPCTYYAPTPSGHLAWTIPLFRQSYGFPGNSLHFFLMFVPYFVMFHRKFVQLSAIVLWLTGPILASQITASVNEQPAIWCFNSIMQALLYAFTIRYNKLYEIPVKDEIHHPGGYSEQPMTYRVVASPAKNAIEEDSLVKPLVAKPRIDSGKSKQSKKPKGMRKGT